MADAGLMSEVQQEVLLLQKELDSLNSTLSEKTSELKREKKEKMRRRLDISNSPSAAMKQHMAQLRETQKQVTEANDRLMELEEEIDKYVLQTSTSMKTLQQLKEEKEEAEAEMAEEERKYQRTLEKYQKLEQEVALRTQNLEIMEKRFTAKDEQMLAERQRASMNHGNTNKIAEDLEELDRLRELLAQMEEDMADAVEAIEQKQKTLEQRKQERKFLEEGLASMAQERDKIMYQTSGMRQEALMKEAEVRQKAEELENLKKDVEFIKTRMREVEEEAEAYRQRTKQLMQEASNADSEMQQARHDIEGYMDQLRERESLLKDLKARFTRAQEQLGQAEKTCASYRDKLLKVDQIAKWRLRKLERQIQIKQDIRRREREQIALIKERARTEKERELAAVRASIREKEDTIDRDCPIDSYLGAFEDVRPAAQAPASSLDHEAPGRVEDAALRTSHQQTQALVNHSNPAIAEAARRVLADMD